MENIERNLPATNTNTERCGQINSGHTAGIRMGRKRHSNTFENTKRNNRLEWKC